VLGDFGFDDGFVVFDEASCAHTELRRRVLSTVFPDLLVDRGVETDLVALDVEVLRKVVG